MKRLFGSMGVEMLALCAALTGYASSPTKANAEMAQIEMVQVPAGTFPMGLSVEMCEANRKLNSALYGGSGDSPPRPDKVDKVHQVTLSAYQIGKYEVTNRQYCSVLNWALAKGYLKTKRGEAWAGSGDIYGNGSRYWSYPVLSFTELYSNIQFYHGVFSSRKRVGLPGGTEYSMDTHPVVQVSWYGAAAFCNWLSEMQGLAPCYDMTTPDCKLRVPSPSPGGYRLPTEAEWERAAAWDGKKHWIYGFTSDRISGDSQCNYAMGSPNANAFQRSYVNPLGLTLMPHTSPVGWFNGVNISPNGNVKTVNSVSPVGAYDMSGNVWEWCEDWSGASGSDGPNSEQSPSCCRDIRGGNWNRTGEWGVSTMSCGNLPEHMADETGFRVAKS
jgi:formylglycine-generating enzyme required for sulfatase activity